MGPRDEVNALLAQHPNVQQLTAIYQGEFHGLGGGVCRAIAAQWIAAIVSTQMTGVDLLQALRTKLGDLAQYRSQLMAAQRDFEFHATAADRAAADGTALAARFQALLDAGNRAGAAAMLPQLQAAQALNSTRYSAMMNALGGHAVQMTEQGLEREEQPFEVLMTRIGRFPPGLHFINIGGRHGVAVYIDVSGSPNMFIDANGGEFTSPDLDSLGAFVAAYTAAIYDGLYDGELCEVHSGAPVLQPGTPSLTTPGAAPSPPGFMAKARGLLGMREALPASGRARPALSGGFGFGRALGGRHSKKTTLKTPKGHHR